MYDLDLGSPPGHTVKKLAHMISDHVMRFLCPLLQGTSLSRFFKVCRKCVCTFCGTSEDSFWRTKFSQITSKRFQEVGMARLRPVSDKLSSGFEVCRKFYTSTRFSSQSVKTYDTE